MSRREILLPWNSQPQEAVRLALGHPLASRINGTLWSTGQTFGDNAGWAKTGTINPAASRDGVGVKGDGTTGYLSRSCSVPGIRPHVMLTIHQEVAATSTARVLYCLGSAAASGGALVQITSGNGTSAVISANHRSTDSAAISAANGPAVNAGGVYASAALIISATATNNRLYVNGSDSSFTTDTPATSTTLVNESVGAQKRGTVGAYSPEIVLFTARFVPELLDSLGETLRQWTAEPWRLFEPRRIWVPVSAGGDVSLALSGAAATSAAGNTSAGTSTALTGVSSTAATGTLATATSVALSGISSTSAAGTLAASISAALTGVSSTAAAGTLSAGGDASAAVTGQAASTAQGTLGVTVSGAAALSGASAAASAGTLSAGISTALTGASAAVSAGSLTAGGDVSVTIAGQAVSTAQGTVGVTATGAVTVALTGAAAVVAAGNIFVVAPAVGWTPVDDSDPNAWIPVDDSNAALWV